MRKGQLTIFIIIGLAVLLIIGLVVLSLQKSEPTTLTAQQDTTTITNLVQQCLNTVGEEGIRTVGVNGGYLDPRTLKYMPNHDSELVFLEPQYIPLWHEIHTCESEAGCLGDHRPALCERRERNCPVRYSGGNPDVSFQENIELFVEREIEGCLNDFVSVPHLLIRKEGSPEINAIIRDNDVLLELSYPMELTTQDDQKVSLDKFSTSLDVNLAQAYELATKIYALELNTNFLENIFLHLISVYGGITSEIPPIRDLQLKGSPNYWVTRRVQQVIEQQILPFTNFIQVVNAKNSYVPIENPDVDVRFRAYATGIYDYMAVKLDETVYPLAVQFEYPYTSMYLDINGKQFLKPKELPGADFLSIVGGLRFLQYKFKYTASYPVLVNVKDPDAFNGNGFELHFGLETNVKNNHPINTSSQILTFTAADTSLDLADPSQLVDHTYRVVAMDRYDQNPIVDAGVNYVCGAEYQMGVTNDEGVWEGKLPYCAAGGAVTIEHIDYATSGTPQDNIDEDGGASNVEVGLWPRQDKSVYLYKRSPANIAAGSGKTPLEGNDSVILTLTRQKETLYDDVVPLAGILEFGSPDKTVVVNDTVALLEQALADGTITQAEYDEAVQNVRNREYGQDTEEKVVDLVPGRYDYSAFLTYYGLIQIPEEVRCSGGLLSRQCVTLEAQNFSSWNSGGALLVDGNGFVLTPEFVYGDTNLTLYVLEQPLPTNWTGMQNYETIQDYQTYGRQQLVQPDLT